MPTSDHGDTSEDLRRAEQIATLQMLTAQTNQRRERLQEKLEQGSEKGQEMEMRKAKKINQQKPDNGTHNYWRIGVAIWLAILSAAILWLALSSGGDSIRIERSTGQGKMSVIFSHSDYSDSAQEIRGDSAQEILSTLVGIGADVRRSMRELDLNEEMEDDVSK